MGKGGVYFPGLRNFMETHPRNNFSGWFSIGERTFNDKEARFIVDYAVRNGYFYSSDIPDEEVLEAVSEMEEQI